MRLIALIGLMSAAAGCGGSATGVVDFFGPTMVRTEVVSEGEEVSTDVKAPDTERYVTLRCSSCSTPLDPGATICSYRECKEEIAWASSYDCVWCKATGDCQTCWVFEQVDGNCYYCGGLGYRAYLGRTRDCPNCKGKKVCPTCNGSKNCDICNGKKKIGMDVIRERVRGADSFD